jgi:hypothetical protein
MRVAALGAALIVALAFATPAEASRTSFRATGNCLEAEVLGSVDSATAREYVPDGFTIDETAGQATLFVFSADCSWSIDGGESSKATLGGAAIHLDTANSPAECAWYVLFYTLSQANAAYAAFQELGWRMLLDDDGRYEATEVPLGSASAHNRNADASYDLEVTSTPLPPQLPAEFDSAVWCNVGPYGLVTAGPWVENPIAAGGGVGTVQVEPASPLSELIGGQESFAGPALFVNFGFDVTPRIVASTP